jgi:5-methylcytosine-specific restriction endonuclease McrA
MIQAGKVKRNDNQDIDHKKPLSKGGSNSLANLAVRAPATNRSFPRNPDGSMKKGKK